jgi:hypothetical protein
MGESAMKFKVKREERRRRTLSENNAFGYFGHTGNETLLVNMQISAKTKDKTRPETHACPKCLIV